MKTENVQRRNGDLHKSGTAPGVIISMS